MDFHILCWQRSQSSYECCVEKVRGTPVIGQHVNTGSSVTTDWIAATADCFQQLTGWLYSTLRRFTSCGIPRHRFSGRQTHSSLRTVMDNCTCDGRPSVHRSVRPSTGIFREAGGVGWGGGLPIGHQKNT